MTRIPPRIPQRRPNKSMSGEQLLIKALTGSHRIKTEQDNKRDEINKILGIKYKK